MQKFTYLFCFLLLGLSVIGQNIALKAELIPVKNDLPKKSGNQVKIEKRKPLLNHRQTSESCGNDTILYTDAKASGFTALTLVGKGQGSYGEGLAQWFEGPQPISISGVVFYGRAKYLPPATVNVSIYSSLNDSTPGSLLGTTTTVLNNTAFTLAAMRRVINFPTPVTVNGNYLVVVEGQANSSDTIQMLVTSDGDGYGEYLSKLRASSAGAPFWLDIHDAYRGVDGGLDADFYTQPIVNYNISSKFGVSSNLVNGVPIMFTNQSSPIFHSRFYNVFSALDITEESFYWNFGETADYGPAVDTSHTYATPDTYTVTMEAAILGWHGYYYDDLDNICFVDSSAILVIKDRSLPITLSSFTGERSTAKNVLKWVTQTEFNSKGFEIQRSADGINFTTIGYSSTKASSGNSTGTLVYNFDDTKPFYGSGYYRLKQIDKDGKFSLSSVVLIKGVKGSALQMGLVYPNPVRNMLNVVLSAPATTKVTVSIADMAGKVVMQKSLQAASGDNNVGLDVSKLSAGSYILKVDANDGSKSSSSRFVKQ